MPIPTLTTPRLRLRGFELSDAKQVQHLAGEFEIADTTMAIPHPYEDGLAENWIETHIPSYEAGKVVNFAICLPENNLAIGSISLMNINPLHRNAEMGYWVGKPYWGKGYCSEAAKRVLEYGFRELDLHRIYAHHMTRNPASGRVLQKIGMQHEGRVRETILKWDKFEDIEIYGILRREFSG